MTRTRTFKVFAAVAILASLASCEATKQTESDKLCDKLPMDMYIWHGCLRDSDFVNRINFGNFDCVYLMDRQFWTDQAHFDAEIDSLLENPDAILPLSKRDMFGLAIGNAHKAGTEVMLTVGNDMLFTALDPKRLDQSTRLLAKTVHNLDIEGLDIDWEVGVYDKYPRHAFLMKTLREKLDSVSAETGKRYKLSTALSAESPYTDSAKTMLADAVDYVNLMSYDLGGCLWRNYASHNTPWQYIKECLTKYWDGIPRNKLHLGLASYGFLYEGLLPDERTPEGENIGGYGRYVNYLDMLPYTFGSREWEKVYDPVEKMNYFINHGKHSFITMETPETINEKFALAVEEGLGGTFWWEYAKDIVPDNNGGKYWQHILVPEHKQITTE